MINMMPANPKIQFFFLISIKRSKIIFKLKNNNGNIHLHSIEMLTTFIFHFGVFLLDQNEQIRQTLKGFFKN